MIELPDATAVQQAVERVLAEPLYWFPVRHHSPAVARHLDAAIRERRPKVVFIEGPAEATHLVPHLVDRRTRPPVALYSSYRDDGNVLGLAGVASPAPDIPARFASWYPLLAYSPEYVAMKAAAAVGAEVELVDLPHAALLQAAEPRPQAPARGAERLIVESRYYQALAQAAGFRTWDQAWDALFEFGPHLRDREAFRRELATFCAAARATTARERIETDGTLPRERHMLAAIRHGLSRRGLSPEHGLVVCGGFHLFLDRDDRGEPPGVPPGTLATSVVPYSYFRVSELSGYGAGNRAPQYYERAWELEGDPQEVLAQHTVAVLKRARREGEAVSAADAISIAQHARLLAALRGHTAPILDDLHEAIVTCCCKGDPRQQGRGLQRALDAVDIGSRIGVVTPDAGQLPLVSDFRATLGALELSEVVEHEKRLTVKLDRREPRDRRRSAFLHRLRFLGVPLGEPAPGGTRDLGAGTIFREVWRLRWSPQVETELVERSLLGDTVEAAALSHLREELARHASQAGPTAARLRDVLDMDLPTMVAEIETACAAAVASDPRFLSLSEALGHLQVLRRHLVHQEQRRGGLEALLEQCFDRACFAIPESANAPEQEQEAIVEGLRVVAEALLGDASGGLQPEVLVQHVQGAAGASHVPFLRGAFLGLLAELRAVPLEETSAELAAFARQPPERMQVAGEFLDGLMAVGRTSVLLGADHLVQAIEDLLGSADHDAFLVMLPRMRSAFARLHERQRLTLADRVAVRHGLKEGEGLLRLATSLEAGVLLARLDAEASRILAGWDL